MVQVETPFNIPGGHYSVRVSLGGSYVGAHINLDRPNVNSNTPVTSNILLSRVLSQKYQENELRNLDEESVVAYLKGNLKWHVERVSIFLFSLSLYDFVSEDSIFAFSFFHFLSTIITLLATDSYPPLAERRRNSPEPGPGSQSYGCEHGGQARALGERVSRVCWGVEDV